MLKLLERATRTKGKGVSAPERQKRVAEAAYFLAEKRGFEPGGELDDWVLAENMIDAGAARGPKG